MLEELQRLVAVVGVLVSGCVAGVEGTVAGADVGYGTVVEARGAGWVVAAIIGQDLVEVAGGGGETGCGRSINSGSAGLNFLFNVGAALAPRSIC